MGYSAEGLIVSWATNFSALFLLPTRSLTSFNTLLTSTPMPCTPSVGITAHSILPVSMGPPLQRPDMLIQEERLLATLHAHAHSRDAKLFDRVSMGYSLQRPRTRQFSDRELLPRWTSFNGLLSLTPTYPFKQRFYLGF